MKAESVAYFLSLIKNLAEKLDLNLDRIKIITEAASDYYMCTSLLALYSGGEVIAYGKDTLYGKFEEITSRINYLANELGCTNKITFTNQKNDASFCNADLITNSGMLRPIDASFLRHVGNQTVISYMCENWEVRSGDVDLEYCEDKRIPVYFSDENDPRIPVFHFCGELAVKLCQEAGVNMNDSNIVVLSSDRFGSVIAEAILQQGGSVTLLKKAEYHKIKHVNFHSIIVAEYCSSNTIIGEDIPIDWIEKSETTIVQFAGRNNSELIKSKNLKLYPDEQLIPNKMCRTLSYLGPLPVVTLQAIGLKVGQSAVEARRMGLVGSEMDKYVTDHSPAQMKINKNQCYYVRGG